MSGHDDLFLIVKAQEMTTKDIVDLQARLSAVRKAFENADADRTQLDARLSEAEKRAVVDRVEELKLRERLSAAEKEVEYQNGRWAQERTNHDETRARLSAAEKDRDAWREVAEGHDRELARLKDEKRDIGASIGFDYWTMENTINDLQARLAAAERDRDSWKTHAKAVEGNLHMHAQELGELRTRLTAAERDLHETEALLGRAEAVVEAARKPHAGCGLCVHAPNYLCDRHFRMFVDEAVRRYEEGRNDPCSTCGGNCKQPSAHSR